MQFDIKSFLQEHGYPIRDGGSDYFTTCARWRSGDDPSSVAVYPKTNVVIDFVAGDRFNVEGLISRVTGIKSRFELKRYLEAKGAVLQGLGKTESLVVAQKVFPPEVLDSLERNHDYFVRRGISEATLELFRGGVCNEGRLKGRYVLPIFDCRGRMVGLIGRAAHNGLMPKYKILGQKKSFVYPAFLNVKDIREAGEIILVESPACVLRLYDLGIKNAICLFGTELSVAVLNFCVKMDPKRIVVSTNNEASRVGNEAAAKIAKKLRKFFDHWQVLVHLPGPGKDFGIEEMTDEQVRDWKSRI